MAAAAAAAAAAGATEQCSSNEAVFKRPTRRSTAKVGKKREDRRTGRVRVGQSGTERDRAGRKGTNAGSERDGHGRKGPPAEDFYSREQGGGQDYECLGSRTDRRPPSLFVSRVVRGYLGEARGPRHHRAHSPAVGTSVSVIMRQARHCVILRDKRATHGPHSPPPGIPLVSPRSHVRESRRPPPHGGPSRAQNFAERFITRSYLRCPNTSNKATCRSKKAEWVRSPGPPPIVSAAVRQRAADDQMFTDTAPLPRTMKSRPCSTISPVSGGAGRFTEKCARSVGRPGGRQYPPRTHIGELLQPAERLGKQREPSAI